MKLNRKLWTAALAVAMTTPSAMAAQDTAGMHYTSASEGFYASIRVRYNANGNSKDGGTDIQNSGSRIGVRGTNDLGGGLEGFYQYEMGVGTNQGDTGDMKTRVAHVGLRGDFGSVVAGAFWTDSYNWVYGSTDVANMQSGSFAYGDFGQGRSNKSLQYTTPDLNGFQGAILIQADSSKDGEGAIGTQFGRGGTEMEEIDDVQVLVSSEPERTIRINGRPTDVKQIRTLTRTVPKHVTNSKDDNDIDHWSLAAKYEIAGFSMGASYTNNPDAIAGVHHEGHKALRKIVGDGIAVNSSVMLTADSIYPAYGKDDLTSWAVKLGYSQDNWYVNSWYGQVGHGDAADFSQAVNLSNGEDYSSLKLSDTTVFSIAGGISVDKVAVYAVHESREKSALAKGDNSVIVKAQDDSYTTLGIQYTLGSNSWTWVEYAGQDVDSSTSEDDTFTIGLGHSF